jgi:hypothetical protein
MDEPGRPERNESHQEHRRCQCRGWHNDEGNREDDRFRATETVRDEERRMPAQHIKERLRESETRESEEVQGLPDEGIA